MDLAELAARQHGVVSIRQLLGPLGYSQSAVARAVETGRLHRLHRGVYAVGHSDISRHGRHLAAVLACAPRALLSHGSAAWLWGLSRSPSETVHVTVPNKRRAKPPLRIHHARLADADRAVCEGIPVTAVPRTLLDLAAIVSPDRLTRAIERAEERRLFDLRAVDALLGRVKGHPGAGRLRNALAIYRPPAFTRSRLERRFRDLVEEAGLPAPSMNFNEAGYELDAYWRAERFVVELDIYETHGTRAAFERDRLRQESLKLIGIEMIRVTGPRLEREPRQVIERIATLLERRRCELGALGSGLDQAKEEPDQPSPT